MKSKKQIIEINSLCFSYEEKRNVLDQISVSFSEGERIAVMGENGAGKSTFFLTLNGVRIPNAGEIRFKGEVITRKNRKRLQEEVGIVFQEADNQIIGTTVKSEIAFGPLNMRLPKEEVETRTQKAMEEMKLTEYADQPPHYLSGGEKKRVSIADILAMDVSVLIFDEPTSSLDPISADMLESVVERLHQSNKTIVISTHDVDFAYRFAERILVFSQGKLIADDTPEIVFSNKELLQRAHLKQPILMQVIDLLQEKKYLSGNWDYPKTIADFEKLL